MTQSHNVWLPSHHAVALWEVVKDVNHFVNWVVDHHQATEADLVAGVQTPQYEPVPIEVMEVVLLEENLEPGVDLLGCIERCHWQHFSLGCCHRINNCISSS
eukprot:EG_transcript_49247